MRSWRVARLRVALLSVFLTLVAAGAASAHTVVSLEEVSAGGYEVLTVRTPGEKDIPVVSVRVEIPDGFIVSRVRPVPGWEYEMEEEGGIVRAITWSGGEIGPTEFQQFDMQGQAPEEPGEYSWSATDTYEDGSEVAWDGPPDSDEPASIVSVVPGEEDEHGSEEGASSDEPSSEESAAGPAAETLSATGGVGSATFVILGACVLAAGVAATRLRKG
ncbi:MAG: YcnI family protein [Rubrobacteraceae bacterium]